MKIIEKYITSTFFKSLVLAVIVFSLLICITYVFDRIYMIFKNDAPFSLFLLSLLYSFPNWFSLVFPIAILLATLFSIGDLARNNEITALRTSGMSVFSISKPLFITGFIVTIFFILFNDTILVNSNRKFTEVWKYGIKKQQYLTNEGFNIVQIEKDKIFSAKKIDGNTEKISGLILIKFDDKMDLVEKLTAKEATWQNKYLELSDISIVTFPNGNISSKYISSEKIEFGRKPSEFINVRKNPEEMSYDDLSNLIIRLKKSGIPSHQEMVQKYNKLAKPFANIIMIFLGIPFAIKTARTAKIFSFAISILTGFLYWGIMSVGLALGMNRTIHPILAAWISNIIFLILALFLINKIEKQFYWKKLLFWKTQTTNT
jgi:lipopolysaccharide export system permease protein